MSVQRNLIVNLLTGFAKGNGLTISEYKAMWYLVSDCDEQFGIALNDYVYKTNEVMTIPVMNESIFIETINMLSITNISENYEHDSTLDNVVMIFENDEGKRILWNVNDVQHSGTPIDEETGQDMEYIGICRHEVPIG